MFLISLATTILVGLVATFVLRDQAYKRRVRSRGCQPPKLYPQKDPFLGLDMFMEAKKMFTEHLVFPISLQRFASLGRTFEVNCLGKRTVHSIEPENIRSVFSTDAASWGVGPHRLPPTGAYFGKGFLTTDGAEWRHARNIFSRSFDKTNVNDYEKYDHYLSLMMDKIPRDGSTVDLQELTFALYTDTSTLFLFGESFESLSRGLTDEATKFVKSLDMSMEGCGIRAGLGPLKFLYRDPAWLAANAQNHAFFQKYADKALASRQTPQDSDGKRRQKLFLEALAEEIDDPIELRNQAIHSFTATHDTTACLISNVMWVLARQPDVFSRLREEILSLGNVKLDFEKPLKLRYLQQVMNEALRLYPPFPFHNREALADCVLPAGGGRDGKEPVFVSAGDVFEANFIALNRDEKIWGPDANDFRPERWDTAKPTAWEFVPFGGGPRNCIGKQKALGEASFFVARMLREFKAIEARDDKEWVGEVKITAKNLNGVHVSLTPA